MIPRTDNAILFDTMEIVGLKAAEQGEVNLGARASRGMNPFGKDLMARKLRTVSKMCRNYRNAGQQEYAVNLIATVIFDHRLTREITTK